MTGRNVRWTFIPVSFSTLVSGNGANSKGSPGRNSGCFLPTQTESGSPGRNSGCFLPVQTENHAVLPTGVQWVAVLHPGREDPG